MKLKGFPFQEIIYQNGNSIESWCRDEPSTNPSHRQTHYPLLDWLGFLTGLYMLLFRPPKPYSEDVIYHEPVHFVNLSPTRTKLLITDESRRLTMLPLDNLQPITLNPMLTSGYWNPDDTLILKQETPQAQYVQTSDFKTITLIDNTINQLTNIIRSFSPNLKKALAVPGWTGYRSDTLTVQVGNPRENGHSLLTKVWAMTLSSRASPWAISYALLISSKKSSILFFSLLTASTYADVPGCKPCLIWPS